MMAANPAPAFPPQQHLAGFDALRGVAALVVVAFHFAIRLHMPWILPHGYLAVDFFFALSGFVLAKSYGRLLASGGLSFWGFAWKRLVRLMPLIVLGTLFAGLVEIPRPGVTDQSQHLVDTTVATLLGSLALPVLWDTSLERALAYPLNLPVWSLFFELVANLCFALVASHKHARLLTIAMAMLGFFALALVSAVVGSIDVGHHVAYFAAGFARVGWSFSAGVVIYALGLNVKSVNVIAYALGMIVVFSVPYLGEFDSWYGLAVAGCVFPVLLGGAARSNTSGIARLSKYLGDLSYPIYALHYPIIKACAFFIRSKDPHGVNMLLYVLASFGLVVGVAHVAGKAFDIPLRRLISSRFKPIAVST